MSLLDAIPDTVTHRSADLFWHTMSLLDVMTHHISWTFQRCRTRHLHTSHHTHATVTGTARPAPPTADGDELATAPTPHQPATPEHAAPGGASSPEDETSSSDNTDTASLSDPQPTEEDTTSAESVSPAPPPKKKKKNHKIRTPTTSTNPLVDFLDLSNVPTRSKQPQPPRRLKLPTVAPDTLRRLRNRTKVVDVDDFLYPRPFGGRAGADGPTQRAGSVAEYMRGVGILVSYRCYFFTTVAVQWSMYAVWLQGQATGLSLASIRALDGQGRTHLAQYPAEYHSPAELTEATQGLLIAAAPRAPPAPPARLPVAVGGPGRHAPRAARPETCLRWNAGRCSNANFTCRRAHTCLDCGGPHQVRNCRLQPGNGPRPLGNMPHVGRF